MASNSLWKRKQKTKRTKRTHIAEESHLKYHLGSFVDLFTPTPCGSNRKDKLKFDTEVTMIFRFSSFGFWKCKCSGFLGVNCLFHFCYHLLNITLVYNGIKVCRFLLVFLASNFIGKCIQIILVQVLESWENWRHFRHALLELFHHLRLVDIHTERRKQFVLRDVEQFVLNTIQAVRLKTTGSSVQISVSASGEVTWSDISVRHVIFLAQFPNAMLFVDFSGSNCAARLFCQNSFREFWKKRDGCSLPVWVWIRLWVFYHAVPGYSQGVSY